MGGLLSLFKPNNDFGFHKTTSTDRTLRIKVSKSEWKMQPRIALHINSEQLKGESEFFLKLFTNGMRETDASDEVIINIDEDEIGEVIELLKFLRNKKISNEIFESLPALLSLLVVADKYDVPSCVQHCMELVLSTMTPESASYCLELSPAVLVIEPIKQVIEAAKKFLVSRYKDNLFRLKEEVTHFPFTTFDTIICEDELQITEDDAFDMVLEWARARSPSLEDRREILRSNLAYYVYPPCMTDCKLREILQRKDADLDPNIVCALVMDALYLRSKNPCAFATPNALRCSLVRIVEFAVKVNAYLEIKCDKHENLLPPYAEIWSQMFRVREKTFRVMATRYARVFGMSLECLNDEGSAIGVGFDDYEFFVREGESGGFVSKRRRCGRDCYGMVWSVPVVDISSYMVDDVLHLRVDISIQ